jgi:hypothetical protein
MCKNCLISACCRSMSTRNMDEQLMYPPSWVNLTCPVYLFRRQCLVPSRLSPVYLVKEITKDCLQFIRRWVACKWTSLYIIKKRRLVEDMMTSETATIIPSMCSTTEEIQVCVCVCAVALRNRVGAALQLNVYTMNML